MKKISFLAVLMVVMVSCSPKTTEIIEVVEVEETVPDAFPSAEVAEGSQLYNDNCGKCHKLKTVTDFTPEQWKTIVPDMAAKAKLDETQENKIMQYVLWKTSK
jgi:mono/diheme cytochrome c family protein